MSYVKVWIHVVWGTKSREPILTKEARAILFPHIKENAKNKGIYIDTVNGYLEHVHCLIALNADTSISKTLQLIKGEASKWLNEQGVIKDKLEWAHEYFAISVSESIVEKVREYIKNQEEHHKRMDFKTEFVALLKKHGVEFDPKYVLG